jgi:hypothetical protein
VAAVLFSASRAISKQKETINETTEHQKQTFFGDEIIMARKIKGGQHQADRPKPQYQGLAQPIGTQTNGQAGKGRVTETSGQSFNGSEPFNEPATGSIIGAVGKGKPQIPWAIFADERLGPTALGILCYVFAKPPGWDISVKELRQRFGGHERLICQGLKQAQQAGWTAFTQLRSMDGRRAYGTKWFARRSLDERWPETFMTRDCNSLKLRFLSLREPRSINDTDSKEEKKKLSSRARESKKRKGSKQTSTSSNGPSFVGDGYQDQAKPKPKAPDKARIAQNLQSNWGGRPLRTHPKWPEFHTWCCGQRDCRGKPGRPNEKGFWTWMSGQKLYWRDKVKELDEELGYDLGGKFYSAPKANDMAEKDPTLLPQFKQATKERGKPHVIRPWPGHPLNGERSTK